MRGANAFPLVLANDLPVILLVLKQGEDRRVQRHGDVSQGLDGRGGLAILHLAQEASGNARQPPQGVQGESSLLTQGADARPEAILVDTTGR
jgi:hypothetical protein